MAIPQRIPYKAIYDYIYVYIALYKPACEVFTLVHWPGAPGGTGRQLIVQPECYSEGRWSLTPVAVFNFNLAR